MLNLIIYCFSQFLMTFLTLIPNFLAWNLLVVKSFARNITRKPYLDFLWVNIDFEKVKIVLKSLVMGLSYVIFLNHRALISVFDHFSLWISFFLLVFASRSQKLTIELPFECQILLCRNSTRTISLEHRFKNVTFTVPQT